MFDYLSEVGQSLRNELVTMYWVLLVPFVVFLIVVEILKAPEENPNVANIFKRVVISMLLLFSFDLVLNVIGMIGDGVTAKIDGVSKLWDVLKNLGPNQESMSNEWFNIRETVLYFFSLAAYMIAYLGFFIATALVHFVWTILYICSPLMILMYVSKGTAFVTSSLYKGLINVVIWKVLWSILGVLLLKLAMSPHFAGKEDFLMSIILNLCIGLAMLFIPIATKSLITDGMQGAASAMAALPSMAAATTLKGVSKKLMGRGVKGGARGLNFAASPLTNPITGRARVMASKLKPRMEKMKKYYSEINLPESAKKLNTKNMRRYHAIRNKHSKNGK